MELSAVLASVLCGVCVLQASAQLTSPSQLNAIVLNMCLPEETLSTRAVDPVITDTLSGIASQLIGGTPICLDQIYVMAFTSDLRYSDSRHPHNIEVVAMGETRSILLPDRPGDYSQHKGDIWRLSISEDLGFSVCVRVCNIQNITLVEGGSNGWNIDSVTTYGCTDDVGCKQITQDFDVFRWVDGDSTEDRQRFTLTKISNTPCTF
jgi:hypothetical protein